MTVYAVNAKTLAGASPRQNPLVLHEGTKSAFLCGGAGTPQLVDDRWLANMPEIRQCARCKTELARRWAKSNR